MSAGTHVEACIVIDARSRDQSHLAELFAVIFDRYEIGIEPVTESQAEIARSAYRQFGRGSEHPANLNFGDCFAYALATERDEPLFFVGDDFIHTDITPR